MLLELGNWEHLFRVDLVGKQWGLQVGTGLGSVMELAFDHHTLVALCAWCGNRTGTWLCPCRSGRLRRVGRRGQKLQALLGGGNEDGQEGSDGETWGRSRRIGHWAEGRPGRSGEGCNFGCAEFEVFEGRPGGDVSGQLEMGFKFGGEKKGGKNLPKSKHISIRKENKDIKRRIFGEITLNKSSQLMNVNSFTL